MSIFFGIVGIVGVLLTLLVFWLGQRDPHPTHHANSTGIVDGGGHGPITVLYKDEVVHRVSKVEVVFWNRGRGTLRREDISANHPVAFAVGGRILDRPELVAVSSEDCDIEVSQASDEPAKVVVGFHHLNHLDGCAFEVLHTGEPGTIERTGGIARTRAVIGTLRPWEVERFHLKLLASVIGVIVLFFAWGIVDALVGAEPSEIEWWMSLLYLLPVVLAVATGLAVYRVSVRRWLGHKVGWPDWAPAEWF